MSKQFTRDMLDPVIAAVEKLTKMNPQLSDEQMKVIQEFVTAQHWQGYAFGYKDAKEGNPNIVELLASITPDEEQKKYYPPLELVKKGREGVTGDGEVTL